METLVKGHFKEVGSGFPGAHPTFAVGVEEQLAAQEKKFVPEVGIPRRQTTKKNPVLRQRPQFKLGSRHPFEVSSPKNFVPHQMDTQSSLCTEGHIPSPVVFLIS